MKLNRLTKVKLIEIMYYSGQSELRNLLFHRPVDRMQDRLKLNMNRFLNSSATTQLLEWLTGLTEKKMTEQ